MPQGGFEPPTPRSSAECSPPELLRRKIIISGVFLYGNLYMLSICSKLQEMLMENSGAGQFRVESCCQVFPLYYCNNLSIMLC